MPAVPPNLSARLRSPRRQQLPTQPPTAPRPWLPPPPPPPPRPRGTRRPTRRTSRPRSAGPRACRPAVRRFTAPCLPAVPLPVRALVPLLLPVPGAEASLGRRGAEERPPRAGWGFLPAGSRALPLDLESAARACIRSLADPRPAKAALLRIHEPPLARFAPTRPPISASGRARKRRARRPCTLRPGARRARERSRPRCARELAGRAAKGGPAWSEAKGGTPSAQPPPGCPLLFRRRLRHSGAVRF